MNLKKKISIILSIVLLGLVGFALFRVVTVSGKDVYLVKGETVDISELGIKKDDVILYDENKVISCKDGKVAALNSGKYDLYRVGSLFKMEDFVVNVVDYKDFGLDKTDFLVGDTISLPKEDKNLNVKYKLSGGKIIEEISSGEYLVKDSGTCRITKTINNTLSFDYDITVENPTLSSENVSLYPNESYNISLDSCNSNAVDWSSEDMNVASVDEGVITTVGSGSTTIHAKVFDKDYICKVDVSEPVSLEESVNVIIGKSKKIPGENLSKDIVWSSSDENIVSFTKKGNLKAVAPGEATITGTIRDLSFSFKAVVPEPKIVLQSETLGLLNTQKVSVENFSGDIEWSVEDSNTASVGNSQEVQSKIQSAFIDDFLAEAKNVADYVRDNGFDYGDNGTNPAMGLGNRKVSCDRFVGWVLYNMGYTDQPSSHGLFVYSENPNHDLATFCARHGFQRIDSLSECQAGDIIFQGFFSNWDKHTYILGNQVGDSWERYDCGTADRISSTQPFVENKCDDFSFAYRPCTSVGVPNISCDSNETLITGFNTGATTLVAKCGNYEVKTEIKVG